MKINTLFFLLALAFSMPTNAQITKNNWLVGGDVAFSYSKTKPESTVDSQSFTINLTPNVGYFFLDKLALGTRAEYTLSRYKSDSGTSKFDRFLISPFARYYLLNIDKMVNPFLESSYRFSLINENNSREFSAKGGVAIFLNNSVAFEASLIYFNSTSNNTYVGNHTLLLGFGIQVHLEKL
ncbi:porin family protein [Salegentibacter sp. LM13S]|uniref:outer membrane beta-barrel protein n=1 Tax=Salegentibacter lacus TaxID=2873599 RepID=UPI001CC9ADEB|nr:outer membrane beta-barrel protein [Salegentibacter lacus]MBZ9631914.1 porin family protein [Salegentibacter lacus]